MDVLSCGRCGVEFSLANLPLFIHHKSLGCQPRHHNKIRQTLQNPPVTRLLENPPAITRVENPPVTRLVENPPTTRLVENPRVSPDSRGTPPSPHYESAGALEIDLSATAAPRVESSTAKAERKQAVDVATNTTQPGKQ